MEIVGTIKKISPVQQISPTFSKRECVILTDEMYPQTIMVEFAQSRAALLDGFTEGQYVRVSINLRGREWTAPTGEVKYFTSVGGWRIEASAPGAAASAAPPGSSGQSFCRFRRNPGPACRTGSFRTGRGRGRPAVLTGGKDYGNGRVDSSIAARRTQEKVTKAACGWPLC